MSDLAYLLLLGPALLFAISCGWYFLWLYMAGIT